MELSLKDTLSLFLFLHSREKELPLDVVPIFRKIEKEMWNRYSIEELELLESRSGGNGI
jgi:hypothetical protein